MAEIENWKKYSHARRVGKESFHEIFIRSFHKLYERFFRLIKNFRKIYFFSFYFSFSSCSSSSCSLFSSEFFKVVLNFDNL